MKTNIATPEFDINGFSATHIIFDNSHYATIWAKCRMQKTQPPYMIVLKEVIGSDIAFTSVRLKVSKGYMENVHLQSTRECLFIEEVWPINIIHQAKNLAQHAKDFQNISVVSDSVIHTSLSQLKEMYTYYLGLMELDIAEASCRVKANLEDDRLFAMAKSSYEKC